MANALVSAFQHFISQLSRAFRSKESATEQAPIGYHSKFGGLWVDRLDWREEIKKRQLDEDKAALVTQFAETGYVIFPQVCPHDAIDAFQRVVARSFREGNSSLLYQDVFGSKTMRLTKPVDPSGNRIVDAYVNLPQALDLFSSPRLLEFLRLIFDCDPLLFQSLSFDQGSQQDLHQDTAYVVVDRPLELAACWIALEDVQEGSGELIYVPGSHRLPDWPFGPDRKHWNPQADGAEPHKDWHAFLVKNAESSDESLKTFLAKKGDILVWHADLAHGGSPIRRSELTRQSLVGHFCPVTAKPNYFSSGPCRNTVHVYRNLAYSSGHYDLKAMDQLSA